jgi:D-alanine--poly(phosphoribitol) ligase subunit 1
MPQHVIALPATHPHPHPQPQPSTPAVSASPHGKRPRAADGRSPSADPLLAHLPPRERRLFWRFGVGPSAAPSHTRIHQAFEAWAARTPDAVAAEHLGARITYAQLDREANRLAALLASRGVRPGDNVALFAERSIPMLVGLLATLKAGAAYVPQDVRICPPAQLRHVVATASTNVVLTLSRFAHAVPVPEGRHLIAIDAVMAEPLAPGAHTTFEPAGTISADSGCYVLFTSGTTGRPNGVVVTHRNVCNVLLTEPGGLGIRPGWRVGQILNIGFDMAAWEILGCLAQGATLVIRDGDIAETARRVQVLIATPTILGGIDPAGCGGVKVVAVAGEPCPRALADRWAAQCVFYNACGPTETTIVNTMQRHAPASPLLTIGRPTPNNTVYVLDEQRRPCRIGVTGEMWAGGDCVSTGYLDNPRLNAERYAPDPFLGGDRMMFRTRDLGRWTRDGELEHLGRTDEQVKIRGFRVELDAVCAVLETVPGCARAATLKLDDRTLISFVSPGRVDPQAARRAVAQALPYYCVPAAVYPMSELPVTARGKIDKAALRAAALRHHPQDSHYAQVAGPIIPGPIVAPEPSRAGDR